MGACEAGCAERAASTTFVPDVEEGARQLAALTRLHEITHSPRTPPHFARHIPELLPAAVARDGVLLVFETYDGEQYS